MNLQQIEYIIAVDEQRHFVRAAKKCFIAQATLSTMIQKLEEELEVTIFDRSKHPVVPTEIGKKVIAQARRIVSEAARLPQLINEEKGFVSGELKIGIIPTLAPYLLPLFLKDFTSKHPQVKLVISEHTTTSIINRLRSGQLDAGILATPLHDQAISEIPLFYEKYYLYVNDKESGFNKQYVLPENIDINRLWLLEEGHCMRSQILNFCTLKKLHEVDEKIHYEAGSIETLKNLVERNFGTTIVPELATFNLSKTQKKRLRYFKSPAPVREISIVTYRDYVKYKLVSVLKESILAAIPQSMQVNKKMRVMEI